MSGQKEATSFRHNFDKVKHSFVVFGKNHSDTSTYQKVRKFSPTLQHH